MQHVDPQEAMRIANTMVDVFVRTIQEMNSENVRAARAFLAEQLEKFEADLERAEEELVLFRQQAAMVQPAGESEAILSGITGSRRSRLRRWSNARPPRSASTPCGANFPARPVRWFRAT